MQLGEKKSEVAKKGEATCGEEMSAKTGEVRLKIPKHTNKSKYPNTQTHQRSSNIKVRYENTQ